jgi:hypothetical protein
VSFHIIIKIRLSALVLIVFRLSRLKEKLSIFIPVQPQDQILLIGPPYKLLEHQVGVIKNVSVQILDHSFVVWTSIHAN